MWQSPNIWVRNSKGTHTPRAHENPTPGVDNYVYVRLVNNGRTAGQGSLELYYAKASTNPNDPARWTLLKSQERVVEPGVTTALFQWPGVTGAGDYGFLARWNTDSKALVFDRLQEKVNSDKHLVWRTSNTIVLGGAPTSDAQFEIAGVAGQVDTYLLVTTKPLTRRSIDWPAILKPRVRLAASVNVAGVVEFPVTLGSPRLIGPIRMAAGQRAQARIEIETDLAILKEWSTKLKNPAYYEVSIMQITPAGLGSVADLPTVFRTNGPLVGGVSYVVEIPADG